MGVSEGFQVLAWKTDSLSPQDVLHILGVMSHPLPWSAAPPLFLYICKVLLTQQNVVYGNQMLKEEKLLSQNSSGSPLLADLQCTLTKTVVEIAVGRRASLSGSLSSWPCG